MATPEDYDLVMLGSGEAGKPRAWTLASQGKRSVVVERRYIGGSCPNIGCLPSKNIIHSAIEPDGGRILGFTAFGPETGEILTIVQVDMKAELPYTFLRDLILTHPTMAEGLLPLFASVPAGHG
jgi:pyruvate/2-oxoglutarate dehydrogenase complex dihydrolipoamide dehydrogenase (E3) component